MSANTEKSAPIAPAGEPPTIEQRVAQGRASQSCADDAIIPLPAGTSFMDVNVSSHVELGDAMRGAQRLTHQGYMESRRHLYRWKTGEEIGCVIGYSFGDKKEFRPMRYTGPKRDARPYQLKASPKPSPLYNLDKIYANPTATIVIVEGEKTADAVPGRFPDFVATTCMGGSAGVASADLRDVRGRTVILWPDNDAPGRSAMDKLGQRLEQLGCTVLLVDVPSSYPAKWDLADDDPAGLPEVELPPALVAAARPFIAAKPSGPRRPTATGAAANDNKADITRFYNAARYLGTTGKRDYSTYEDWFALMCAAKHGFGDAAFPLFVEVSCEYGGTDTEDEFRKKWDSVADREDGSKITPGTFFAQAKEAGWTDPSDDILGESSGRPGRADPAAVVLEQSADAGDELWTDQFGKAHVTMLVGGEDEPKRTVHARIGGKRHKGIISQRYLAAYKTRVLAAEQERRAVQLFEHNAREGGIVHESANRAAAHGGDIYVDLGTADGSAVRVTAEGWSVVPSPPTRFVRGGRGELPVPVAGGTLEDFGKHLNLSPRDLLRLLAFVVGALAPLPSFPILLIDGGQGTAKSTMGDIVLALCDPPTSPKAGRMTMPKGDQNLMVHAAGLRVVYVDNLSDITQAEADMFCRLSTGGGTSARQHYSDEDEVQMSATRPAIVTAIGVPSARGDFLDRCVRVTAQPIVVRRTEEAVLRAFEADRPRLFGFVLTMLSAAIRNKAAVEALVEAGELRLTRMADFAVYAEAAAEVLGQTIGAFSADLLEEQANMQAEAALGDPLGDALFRYFSADAARAELRNHATEFLDELQALGDNLRLPASNKLKGALRRIEPGLRDLGLVVEVLEPAKGARNRKAMYAVTRTDDFQPRKADRPF